MTFETNPFLSFLPFFFLSLLLWGGLGAAELGDLEKRKRRRKKKKEFFPPKTLNEGESLIIVH